MSALWFALSLLPASGRIELLYRVAIVHAVQAVTGDEHEQRLLLSIARWESHYREDVGDCRVLGKAGEKSLWQVLPRPGDRLCESLEGDARIALDRVRESRRACGHLPDQDKLSAYAIGRCVVGNAKARRRWVE